MTHRPRPPVRSVPRHAAVLLVLALSAFAGCSGDPAVPEVVWGKQGVQDGDLSRPRAIAIDSHDRLYIVDFTARIQVYDRDGKLSRPDLDHARLPQRPAQRPQHRPRRQPHLLSDSHYHFIRIYSPEGKELRSPRRRRPAPAPDNSATSATWCRTPTAITTSPSSARTTASPSSIPTASSSSAGGPRARRRDSSRAPRLALGPKDGYLYVADAVNNRIQVFTRDGELVRLWGEPGAGPGQMKYPYDLAFDKNGDLYVVEFGNDRIQKFTAEGKPLGMWGGPGREPGRLNRPWALAVDSRGSIHVVDTENHRVQRVTPW